MITMITRDYLLPPRVLLTWFNLVPINTVYCGQPRIHVHSVPDDGIIFAGADIYD